MATDTTTAAPRQRSRGHRALRALGWTVAGLVTLVLLLAAGAWWWLGSSQSLAFALTRAALYLPAGQTLQSRDVSGSLRAGGRIGWLRWQSESLAVEVQDARIGWSLAPLLQRKLQLGEVHAALVSIEPQPLAKDDSPPTPLEEIVLPVEVELPFRIDTLRWTGPPTVTAEALKGTYRYTDLHHALDIDGVDLAEGHYAAKVKLQGPAPMALEAALEGRVQAPLPDDRRLAVAAQASLNGALAGANAKLNIAASLKPVDPDARAPMQADLQATVAPWQSQPVLSANAELQNLDAASLWPGAPTTLLTGSVAVQPDARTGTGAWQGQVDLRNARPGPWDKGRLPVEQLKAGASFDGTTWTLSEADIRAGGGRIEAEGQWSPAPSPWEASAKVRGVRPNLLHSELAGAPVNGQLTAAQRGDTLTFNVGLQAEGGAGANALQGFRVDRIDAKGQWKDQLLDLQAFRMDAQQARLEGKAQVQMTQRAASGDLSLTLPGGTAKWQGRLAPAQGAGTLGVAVADAATVQRWVESLPGLAKVFAGASMDGNAQLDAQWQGGWETMARRLTQPATPLAAGTAEPVVSASFATKRLDLRLPPAANAPPSSIQLRDLSATLSGSLPKATLALKGEALTGTRKINLDAQAVGGLDAANRWRAALNTLRLQTSDTTLPGPWTVELDKPVNATIRTDSATPGRLDVEASAAAVSLRGPVPGTVRVEWQPLNFTQAGTATNPTYRLRSQGRLLGLPMAWAEAFGSSGLAEAGITGNLIFDGEWDIDAGDALRARARLARRSGDIRVQAGEAALVTRIVSRGTGTASERTVNSASPDSDAPSTPAGLRQAELRLDAEGDAIKAQLAWDSERAGQINADASTRVVQRDGGWQWADDAPLAGRIAAKLPSLGVWSMLAPPSWRIAGTLDASATLSGSRAAPRWNGTLGADQLALRAPVEGLDLRDGKLRATLTGDRVEITEFTLRGGAPSTARIAGQSGNRSTAASEAAAGGGTLSVTGQLSWGTATAGGSGIRMALEGQLRRLRLLVRSDRQIALSGALQARLENGQFVVRGDLKTDRAVIILPDETAPSLGTDVVVRSAAKDREAALAAEEARRREARVEEAGPTATAKTAKPPDLLVSIDLGDDFAVQGRGITTRLEGKLDIRSTALNSPPRITGEVKTVRGRYRAYGQELDVETGVARFNGPYDNPALDILAIRPNIAHRAGVQITGSALSPRVRLYAEPALSDAETLSWVVLGRASATSGGESALLQQAALALLGGLGKGGTGGSLASRFGLDEIGFKGPGSGGDLRESAVTVGKRISKDFYVTYERSLAGTLGTLFIFYDLTQRLTLRGQAGQRSGLDLIYTLKYD